MPSEQECVFSCPWCGKTSLIILHSCQNCVPDLSISLYIYIYIAYKNKTILLLVSVVELFFSKVVVLLHLQAFNGLISESLNRPACPACGQVFLHLFLPFGFPEIKFGTLLVSPFFAFIFPKRQDSHWKTKSGRKGTFSQWTYFFSAVYDGLRLNLITFLEGGNQESLLFFFFNGYTDTVLSQRKSGWMYFSCCRTCGSTWPNITATHSTLGAE